MNNGGLKRKRQETSRGVGQLFNMAQRWRSSKKSEKETKGNVFELGGVFERMVKGMRNEMSTVLSRIERSRDLSLEAIRGMLKNGLESMVGAVEKVMTGVSDGMAKEWRARCKEEKEREDRARIIEDRRDREAREREERGMVREEWLKVLEERMEEKASGEKLRKMRDRIKKDMKDREEDKSAEGEDAKMEERLKEEVQKLEREDREGQERLDRVEANVTRDRKERQDCERKKDEYQERHAEMESRKEMEKKVQAAMEQIKILNLDFGRECNERTRLVEEVIRLLLEKVGKQDREEI